MTRRVLGLGLGVSGGWLGGVGLGVVGLRLGLGREHWGPLVQEIWSVVMVETGMVVVQLIDA